MRGRPAATIDWHETVEELKERYRQEREPELKVRLHGLWLMREGRSQRETARLVGMSERTIRQWVSWYRQGGLVETLRHRMGGRQGRKARLSKEQEASLIEAAAEGQFRTVEEARNFVKERFGESYTYFGLRSLLIRLGLHKKVPRPLADKASLEAQDAWKKGS